jgi:hypothetical protein
LRGLLATGCTSESDIHQSVIKWACLHKNLRNKILHFPNEGKRTPRYGKYLKSLGMRAGVSDIFIPIARHQFHGAWIELKSEKGRLSLAQKEFLEEMKEEGYFAATCYSFDEAINTISWYCL